ncbi:MAG: hypothetical protein COT36_04960 [Parcubacteria group bacterium CG08_land_8_20_14_0_20_38_56]|nr:MAG: hypothetical protein COT36_04960 [Parcubacteria group bacterium CG08_land_8_20_14_0_20_38_56]
MTEQNSWQRLVELMGEIPQLVEGIDLETLEDGSIKIEEAENATRKITETLAGLYAIRHGGRFTPDLEKIPGLEEALGYLERIPGIMAVREVTDLHCRIRNAKGGFDIFKPLLQEAQDIGPLRLIGRVAEFTREDGSKGTRVEFLDEVKMPRSIPPKVWKAQLRVYNPQTKETAVYFPRDWRNDDHFAVANALRELYQRAREEHREFRAERDAQREAEKPYFEQGTLGNLAEALVGGKKGTIAFGFNHREQYSNKPSMRGVVVVEAKVGSLVVKDFTPSFGGIGLGKGAEYPFTAGERPDLRKVPQPLKYMLLTVLDSIRKRAGEIGGTETRRGETKQQKDDFPPPPESKHRKRTPKKAAEIPEEKKTPRAKKVKGGRAGEKVELRQEVEEATQEDQS